MGDLCKSSELINVSKETDMLRPLEMSRIVYSIVSQILRVQC